MKRITIGRGNDCDIVVPDESDNVSRHHLVITFSFLGKMTISDTSSNGTFINGNRMLKGTSLPVSRNDKVQLGNSWVLDWSTVADPYRNVRRLALVALIALVLVIGGMATRYFVHESAKENAVPTEIPVGDAGAQSGAWNKDSTLKVAPKEKHY